MDALAGYGTDESTSADSADPATKDSKPAQNMLAGLLGDVSDASEDAQGAGTSPAASSEPPTLKKPRIEAGADDRKTEAQRMILAPILGTGENSSWICWKANYLSTPVTDDQRLSLESAPNMNQFANNLQRLAQSMGKSSSPKNRVDASACWADHLRSQHEFHNPHFFASIVEHFGIQDPLASSVGYSTQLQEYERQMFPVFPTTFETDPAT